jgi:hypothetical protein
MRSPVLLKCNKLVTPPVFLCAFGGPQRPQIDATMSPDKPSALLLSLSLVVYICIYTRRPSGSSVSAHSLGEIIACVLGIANLHIVGLAHSFWLCQQYRAWNVEIGDRLHILYFYIISSE